MYKDTLIVSEAEPTDVLVGVDLPLLSLLEGGMLEGPITEAEVSVAIQKLSNYKPPVTDALIAESYGMGNNSMWKSFLFSL